MRKKITVNHIFIFVFLCYLIFFTLGSIVKKDEEFSEMENRYLNQFPEFLSLIHI